MQAYLKKSVPCTGDVPVEAPLRDRQAAQFRARRERPLQAEGTVARAAGTASSVGSTRRIDDCPCESGIARSACPCCGFRTLIVSGGTAEHEICQVCFWQHDHVDEAAPEEPPLGPNRVSLSDARTNFRAFGACEERWVGNVRRPRQEESVVKSRDVV